MPDHLLQLDVLSPVVSELLVRHGASSVTQQQTSEGMTTLWTDRERIIDVLRSLKTNGHCRYRMLLDLTAIDERQRTHRRDQPHSGVTIVYHLISHEQNQEIRVKVPLSFDNLTLPTATSIWPNANWYEREVWDMFGVTFTGHPNLRRMLMPQSWNGHPLRKDHYARATEKGPFTLSPDVEVREQKALQQDPEYWKLTAEEDDAETMVVNLGPNHPSTHGVFRLMVKVAGEQIVDIVPEIGFHHRGAEKMAERQSWHSFIPYTDRIDYVGGVMNNFPYVMGVETLAGITVPPRAQMIRIMLAELFRIISHLVFVGTMSQDVGQLSPVFYIFTDRERALEIVEAICGFRMHPAFFRIGGVAADLPDGWKDLIQSFLDYLPKRLAEYETLVMRNRIFKARTVGIGEYSLDEALEWGVTGPSLRACGMNFDYRKQRPYSGYDQLEFDVPLGNRGDAYTRVQLRIHEMRQSLRIIAQCLKNMPDGPHKASHPQTTPPLRERTLQDIETLIPHFLNMSWGPVIPPGEVSCTIEATKGLNTYYMISDGNTASYRTRIRTPSFAHLQMIPLINRGAFLADLIAIIGSIDFVMADVDR